jgi:PPK2 family polyphosphate:nucleotide phosphotransferase
MRLSNGRPSACHFHCLPFFSREVSTVNVKSKFLVEPHERVKLNKRATKVKESKKAAEKLLAQHRQQLYDLQELLTAEQKHAVLIVLQGMDTSGKDGTIRHIFTGVNPQACTVTPFKVPTPLEQRHDFLWRVHAAVPPVGSIGIFNRSHYEDVLVTRVHKTISSKEARRRCDDIVEFERMLSDNGVTILKFFLHISADEQKRRLEARLADKDKHWKINPADFSERHLWPEYQIAYEEAIERSSRKSAPWFIIPADDKEFRNVAISEIVIETMQGLKMQYPRPTFDPATIKL